MNPENLYTYRAKLCRVIDGDSVRMLLDLGIFVHTTQAIRVKDVDCAEIFSGSAEGKEKGQEAKAWTEGWFEANDDGSEWPFLVRTYRDKQSFNRYVADVVAVGGSDLATDLVAGGYAVRV